MTRLSDVISRMTRRHRSAFDVKAGQSQASACKQGSGTARVPTDGAENSGNPASEDEAEAEMKACLSTFDLISLGVGSCLGTGMYLTSGIVASTMAGPAGVISLLLAGAASMLTGVCYAELAGLCPKSSGSAYMYAYMTVGEFAAFVIGWGLVVEYVIGTAAGAVALSETLDSLSNGFFSSYFKHAALVIGLPKMDLLAAAICLLLTLLLASGAEMSAKVNNGLNITNLTVLLFFVIASLWLGTSRNLVAGGFFPFGINGVVRAIPTCYFAYIGFDTVAAAGAEARDPSRSLPLSLLLSILINCVAYVIVILALTFDLPFYLLPHDTAMTDVFPRLNFLPGKYVVAVGAVSGEFAATFGSMFPLPRVLTAMAGDGLIFRQLGQICPKRHTPVKATFLSGFVAMVMATFFNLDLLIELVLIGTLLAYVLVTFALLFTRYVPEMGNPDSAEPVSETRFFEETNLDSSSESLEDTLSIPTTKTRSKEFPSGERNRDQQSRTGKRKGKPSRGGGVAFSLPSSSLSNGRDRWKGREIKGRGAELPAHDSDATRTPDYHQPPKKTLLSSIRSIVQTKVYNSKDRKAEYHPLLDVREEQHEGTDSGDAEDVIYQARDSTKVNDSTSNGGGQGRGRTLATPNRQSELRKLLVNSLDEGEDRSSFPSWLVEVTDLVDRLAGSPRGVVGLLLAIYGMEVVMCVVVSHLWQSMADGGGLSLILLGLLSVVFVGLVAVLIFLPDSVPNGTFRAPLVPVLPIFVAFLNIFLMTSLSLVTWLLFALWMAVGMLVYFLYGQKHSQATTTTTLVSVPLLSSHIAVVLDDDDSSDEDVYVGGDDEVTSLLPN